jgi:hypothetical protein
VWFGWLLLLFVLLLFGSFDLFGVVMTPLDCVSGPSQHGFLVHPCPKNGNISINFMGVEMWCLDFQILMASTVLVVGKPAMVQLIRSASQSV